MATTSRVARCTTALLGHLLLSSLDGAFGQHRGRWHRLREKAMARTESLAATVAGGGGRACLCEDPSLCLPIHGPPVAEREVYGFVGGDGSEVDFSRVTTVAWADPDNAPLLCRAHAAGARVVLSAPRPERVLTPNATARAEWVASAVAAVVSSFHDGVVFDWEEPCAVGSSAQHWYAVLIAETRAALRRVHSGYQASTYVRATITPVY